MSRLKRVLAGVALKRWRNRAIGQAWAKWRYEVRRTHIVGRAIMRWQHRLMSRALQAWEWMLMDKKRLRAIVAKCVGRWKHRAQARAWEQWYEQHEVSACETWRSRRQRCGRTR